MSDVDVPQRGEMVDCQPDSGEVVGEDGRNRDTFGGSVHQDHGDPGLQQLEDHVVGIVGRSPVVARHWRTPLAFLFIDGGHGVGPARDDYLGWTPHIAVGGTLAIHDVFPDPADGGRPPYEQIYVPALESGRFRLESVTGSLRVLRRVD